MDDGSSICIWPSAILHAGGIGRREVSVDKQKMPWMQEDRYGKIHASTCIAVFALALHSSLSPTLSNTKVHSRRPSRGAVHQKLINGM